MEEINLFFEKIPEQNIVAMSRLEELNELGYPILLGTSRKSLTKTLLASRIVV